MHETLINKPKACQNKRENPIGFTHNRITLTLDRTVHTKRYGRINARRINARYDKIVKNNVAGTVQDMQYIDLLELIGI